MSIFSDHITNQDDFILEHYNWFFSTDYGAIVLVEKSGTFTDALRSRSGRMFVPISVVWDFYMNEGVADIARMLDNYDLPSEWDFSKFAHGFGHPDIRKLIFKNQIYFDKAVLWPLYNAFNEYWISQVIRRRAFQHKKIYKF
jgi:hypothetical protein